MNERVADVGAATSIVGWLASLAAQALPIVQFVAGCVAIIAGLAATYYHVKKARSR